MHVRAAIRHGLSKEEIAEIFLHTAPYAGIPAASAAFTQAQQVLADEDLDGPAG
jgi:alkylhydroperoxidase/carboxymuconolactone decarboxylase family protein YurZ